VNSRLSRLPPALVWLYDVALAGLCMAGVILVRYRFEPKPLPPGLTLRSALAFAAVCAVVFPAFRLHRGLWRHTAAGDVSRIARAAAASVLLVLPVLFVIDRLADFPRSTPLLLFPLLVAALAAGRLLAHAAAHGGLSAALRPEPRTGAGAVVLVGSPAAAADYLGAARRKGAPVPRVLGLVTPEPSTPGRTVHGAEVLGPVGRLADLLRALTAARGEPPQVLLAEPRPGRDLLEAVVRAAAQTGCRVVRVRGEGAGGPSLGPVEAADLLDRPHHALDPERARGLIAGRRVLVTGAGGTIGSELTRQALALGPERLVLYDSSEFNLYAIDQALEAAGAAAPWRAVLGDVRDAARLAQVFAEERPDVVLHAAALKHVPLMELNPLEAVLTNIGGAINVARLARDTCEALVFISTDKAVNPTNVMGATKRVAERAVQAITAGGRVRTAVVRFGNVLGSTGSVVPLFERQIAEGGPVTVTHPDMVRWFMSVREAAGLVLQAAALPDAGPKAVGGGGGRVFVLDMGEPVRIEDLARQLIGLHGLRPGVDIDIVHTGLRPGEKLSEDLFYDAETVAPTDAPGVLAAYDPAPPWPELAPRIAELLASAGAGEVAEALARLEQLEPAFRRA